MSLQAACQWFADSPVQRLHCRDVDNVRMLDHLERMPQLVADQREQLIAIPTILVWCDDHPKIAVTSS